MLHVSVDPQTGDEVIQSADLPSFPARWGVLVGELIHNLRSALDYLIGEFVREGGREPDSGNAFPISKTRARYLKKKRGVTY